MPSKHRPTPAVRPGRAGESRAVSPDARPSAPCSPSRRGKGVTDPGRPDRDSTAPGTARPGGSARTERRCAGRRFRHGRALIAVRAPASVLCRPPVPVRPGSACGPPALRGGTGSRAAHDDPGDAAGTGDRHPVVPCPPHTAPAPPEPSPEGRSR
ncbi:hypothetical protein GCM10018777_39050 [Streptomyces albogriseolus]|nr:hypothetical protein GCM10018777_39050 [Streptomyces viridodiastaticus]